MNQAVLSLGSNMGDRLQYLEAAKAFLEKNSCKILKQSSVYETEAWGNEDQAAFYNEAIEIETDSTAEDLMKTILKIEESLGRIRTEKWAPRTIDIDILFFNTEIIHQDSLTVPHPHLHERKFVLVPLSEILPGLIHPVLKKTVSSMLSELADSLAVKKI